jgi:hypothetical protein
LAKIRSLLTAETQETTEKSPTVKTSGTEGLRATAETYISNSRHAATVHRVTSNSTIHSLDALNKRTAARAETLAKFGKINVAGPTQTMAVIGCQIQLKSKQQ